MGQYAVAAGLSVPDISTLTLLGISAAGYFGALLFRLVSIYAIPRLQSLLLKPDVTYRVYGFHYAIQRLILRGSNSHFFLVLFGDSSAIVHYMRYVGWALNKVRQTGSNMGTNQRHDNPFLCNIGSGTMVSDGLSMINTHMSATSFKLAEARIGQENSVGNDVLYPPDGRTGANVLIGTKTLIPIDGPVRENVGLLGSPAFEIPRVVDRDRELNASIGRRARRVGLHRKNAHNIVTALMFLFIQWMWAFVLLVLWRNLLSEYDHLDVFWLCAAIVVTLVGSTVYIVALVHASLHFRRLKPRLASIYDPYFWFIERYWKLTDPVNGLAALLSGTPFRPMLMRALGMRVGRKVFDCSGGTSEWSLTEIGDYANLNEQCVLQAHSLEEGVFKSDTIRLGSGCSVGPGAFVHYGVRMGDHVILDADSFLMKGEVLEPHTGWRGNPAKMVRCHAAPQQLERPRRAGTEPPITGIGEQHANAHQLLGAVGRWGDVPGQRTE